MEERMNEKIVDMLVAKIIDEAGEITNETIDSVKLPQRPREKIVLCIIDDVQLKKLYVIIQDIKNDSKSKLENIEGYFYAEHDPEKKHKLYESIQIEKQRCREKIKIITEILDFKIKEIYGITEKKIRTFQGWKVAF